MDTKKYSTLGRPRGTKGNVLEEKVILPILDYKGMTFKEYWELYMGSPGMELRAKQQRLPSEDGTPRFLPPEEVETINSYVTQTGFREWFSKRGLKLQRLANLLSLLKLKVVIVPFHSNVVVKCDGSTVKCEDIGEAEVSVFSFDERDSKVKPKLVYTAVPLPEEKVILRKARPRHNQIENNINQDNIKDAENK